MYIILKKKMSTCSIPSLATWHQYDDTIFSPPGWLQSLRNKMPFLKSMDPADGRNIATCAMLPRWEGFTTDEARTNMTPWEAVEAVNDIAYCMTETLVEEGWHFTRNIPLSYDFSRVSHHLIHWLISPFFDTFLLLQISEYFIHWTVKF